MTDLAGERAASAARKAGQITDARARYLRDNAIRMRLPLTQESLAESARVTWAHLPEETTDAVVARALEMAPAAAERREETMGHQTDRVRIIREAIAEELRKDPGLSSEAIRERVECRRLGPLPGSAFTLYCTEARKQLGVQARVGRPRKNGGRPKAAKPEPARRVVEVTKPTPPELVEPAPPSEAAVEEIVPATVETAPEPVVEIALGPVVPITPSAHHPASVVEITGVPGSFHAARRDDGSWDVEIRTRADEDMMSRLAGALWEVLVAPRSAA